MDYLNRALKWIDHNRYLVLSFILSAILIGGLIGALGCNSTTLGFFGKKVERPVFNRQAAEIEKNLAVEKIGLEAALAKYNARVESVNAQIAAGMADLDRQDAIRAEILATIGTTAPQIAAGSISPWALLPLGLGIFGTLFGLNANIDKRRTDAVLAKKKHGGN